MNLSLLLPVPDNDITSDHILVDMKSWPYIMTEHSQGICENSKLS